MQIANQSALTMATMRCSPLLLLVSLLLAVSAASFDTLGSQVDIRIPKEQSEGFAVFAWLEDNTLDIRILVPFLPLLISLLYTLFLYTSLLFLDVPAASFDT